jgi:AP-2 complex subunit mu-1
MTLVETDVSGTVLVRAKLSGMPGCKLAFESKEFEDAVYHPCVKVDKFEKGVIKFVPPDGQTEILRYRMTKHVKLPFRVLPVITQPDPTRIEIKANIKAAFSKDLFATDVVLRIPCPRNTITYTSKASKGTVQHVHELECLYWKIPKFQGETDATISAEIKVVTGEVQESDGNKVSTTIPPLLLEFNIIGYAASGMRVRYLEIYESGEYEKESWIRYMTTSGSFQIRVAAPNVNSLEFANPQ